MKRNLRNSIISYALLMLLALATACNKQSAHEGHVDTYTCPMHPTVISETAGKCPVCGMDLVRKARPGEAVEITGDISRLLKSPNESVIASVKTVKGEYKSMQVDITAQGVVTYDTKNLFTLPARMSGRLEKVYPKYPYQAVKKGQKVAEIYSPELVAAERELLFLLENDAQNELLIKGGKERLRLLGATDAQINTIIQRKDPQLTFSIYSPYDGYVISETQQTPVAPGLKQVSGGMGESMVAASPVSTTVGSASTESLIREGSYVNSGQTLFRIVNTSAIRVELNVPSSAAGIVKKGTKVNLDFDNGNKLEATVDFIQPFFNEGQEFLTVRAFIKNSSELHIGHLVNARLTGAPVEALWVPKDAVLDLGVDKIVFIKANKMLTPQKVIVGIESNGLIEIKKGLSSSDEIASKAQYLVDSESFIKIQQ